MIDKNMEHILAAHLNLNSSDVQSIESATDKDSHSCIYVTLARNPRITCPHDASHHIQSNGYYTRRIMISDRLFESTDVYLKVPRYYCKDCHKSFSEDFHMTPAGKTGPEAKNKAVYFSGRCQMIRGAEKKRTIRPLYDFIFPDSPPVSRNRKLSADGRSHHIPWYISRGRECGPPSAG